MRFLFNASMPCDAAYADPFRDLVDRVAQYAGYHAAEARQIADHAADALAQLPRSPENAEFEFKASETTFDVTMVVAGALTEAPPGFTSSRDGGRTVFRLTRKLPEAFSH